jgi:hypothetical protein
MMQFLFTVLFISICPLLMFFMMRGMRAVVVGMTMQKPALPMLGSFTQGARIADLESEVARLSKARRADGTPCSIVAAGVDAMTVAPESPSPLGARIVSSRRAASMLQTSPLGSLGRRTASRRTQGY